MTLFQKIFKLPKYEWSDFFESLILSVGIRIMILVLPLKRYKYILGQQNSLDQIPLNTHQRIHITRVAKAIVRARRITPWKNHCLTEAITAKIMLKHRNVATTLYLGVSRTEKNLKAHAWLCSGTLFITGKRGFTKFVIVSTFS